MRWNGGVYGEVVVWRGVAFRHHEMCAKSQASSFENIEASVPSVNLVQSIYYSLFLGSGESRCTADLQSLGTISDISPLDLT